QRPGQGRAAGELGQVLLEPRLERVDDRPGAVLADVAPAVGVEPADVALDQVQLGDAPQRLAGDRTGGAVAGGVQLVEVAAHVGPAEGEGDLAGERRRVGAVAVDL